MRDHGFTLVELLVKDRYWRYRNAVNWQRPSWKLPTGEFQSSCTQGQLQQRVPSLR